MSNKIDKFISALKKAEGDELIFATGRPVRIRIGDDEKVVLDQEVRTDQVDKLVAPCVPEDEVDGFLTGPEGLYAYESPEGMVQIQSRRKGGNVMVTISFAGGGGVEEDAPLPLQDTGAGFVEGFDSGRHGGGAREIDAEPEAEEEEEPPPPKLKVQPQGQGGHGGGHGGGGHGGGGHGGGGHGGGGGPKYSAPEPNTKPRTGQIDKILTQLAKAGASDLHLSSDHRPKMRKDGDIQDVPGWDIVDSDTIQKWMFEVAPKRIQEQYLETNDADYAHEVVGVARFRMNIFRDRRGTGAVIRTIPSKVLTADELGLPPVTRTFCNFPKGLVLVTGPTGSGKSTTLAAMIDYVNKQRSDHIITIEDPVEFVHQSQKCLVNQREVHTHTESFARALRAALREDPDIVLVGEMRDLETVHIAIETAETGHLVFGTLHTNTAPSTVDRIIDQFPTDRQAQIRVMLSESLKGVISQTLCRKIGGGRCACLEILVVNSAIANLIREGKTFQIPSIMQTGKAIGMQTQVDAMMDLVKANKVAPMEAYTKAVDQGLMKGALERAGHRIDAK
ncbi:MAG: type IV pilus twitching motility protein PilT [Myxococcota bacterium]